MVNTVYEQLALNSKYGIHLFIAMNLMKASKFMRQNYLAGHDYIEETIDKKIEDWFNAIDILELNKKQQL
tara:strand:+ start:10471 stop:10680 length:210 start_codon:yes stop_codon:yes gene_type:complete